MSIKSFCSGLYNFFAWPIRKINEWFKKKSSPIVSPREPKPELSPTLYRRAKIYVLKEQEEQGKIHFKPLFFPNHFNTVGRPYNDLEFKSNYEQAKKKKERIKARKAMMKMLEEMEEIDKLEEAQNKKKKETEKDSPIKPTNSK